MNKHTPGPWIAGDDEDSDLFLVGPETYPGLVTRPVVKLHNEADARLIAAAPELLEALEFGRTAIGEHIAPSDCYATGPLTGNYIEDLIVCPACRFISAYEKAIAKAKGE